MYFCKGFWGQGLIFEKFTDWNENLRMGQNVILEKFWGQNMILGKC